MIIKQFASIPLVLSIIFLISSSVLTQEIPLSQSLPPFLAGHLNHTCILSGFGQSLTLDTQSGVLSTILPDLEAACRISQDDVPFYPRLFVDKKIGSYYYCPQNQSLLVLDSTKNFAVTGKHISLSNLPLFDEVRIKAFSARPNTLVLLGLINSHNLLDNGAKNYTQSYMVTILWEIHEVMEVRILQGAHGEPIIDIEALYDNQIVSIGEKVYSCGQKIDTYYLGKWGDKNFNVVFDFYSSSSFGFIPQVKATADGKYLVYSNYESIFVYCIETGSITHSSDVTLVSSNYSINGQVVMHWEQIPFMTASEGKVIYVFYQGKFQKYEVPNLDLKIEGNTVPVHELDANSTYSRFFFFEDQSQDKVLVQIDNSASLFTLNSNEAESIFDILQ